MEEKRLFHRLSGRSKVRVRKKDDLFDLEYAYLTFPEPPKELATPGLPTSEGPEITKLTDSDIPYRYRKGPTRTQTFKAVTKRAQAPTFPG